VVAIATVFATQRRNAGFATGHHGWVSAHGLAIAAKAVPAAGFLGHSMRVEGRKGAVVLDYFDRYPVFFSALAHQVLALGDPDLETRILRARHLMNAVFGATMLAVYALLRLVGWLPGTALAATLLAFSGTYLLAYKDMFHFDQPALLGMVLVWIGIAKYERDGRRGLLYALALLAVCLGRGAASLGALAAWLLLQLVGALRDRLRGSDATPLALRLLRLEPVRLLVVCGALVAALLAYNVAVESRQTGQPWLRTSIVGSAAKRFGLDPRFDSHYAGALAWGSVLATQGERLLIALTPAALGVQVDPTVTGPRARLGIASGVLAGILLVLAGLALVAGRPGGALTPLQRTMLAILALSGPLWLLAVRRLAQFHDYTAIYDLGTVLAIDLLALSFLPRRLTGIAAALALALFAAGNLEVARRDGEAIRRANAETQDFERIAAALPPDARVHVDGNWETLIPGVPYALGFYLPRATVVEELRRADWVISRKRIGSGGLTPENRALFAYPAPRRGRTPRLNRSTAGGGHRRDREVLGRRPRELSLVEEPPLLAREPRAREARLRRVTELNVDHDDRGQEGHLRLVGRIRSREGLLPEAEVVDPDLPEIAGAVRDVRVEDGVGLLVDEDEPL
jgi:hypothetical protein